MGFSFDKLLLLVGTTISFYKNKTFYKIFNKTVDRPYFQYKVGLNEGFYFCEKCYIHKYLKNIKMLTPEDYFVTVIIPDNALVRISLH